MQEFIEQLEKKCKELNKPIIKIVIENDLKNETAKIISVIGEWVDKENASESLDFLIDNIFLSLKKDLISRITYIYIFKNMDDFQRKVSMGFRKIGIFH
jgi:uncharacterized radical SAM superfamily Fe-S cluster-containing enzyme